MSNPYAAGDAIQADLMSAPEIRAAVLADRRRKQTHRGRARPPQSTPDAIADVMLKRAAASGACTEDDLINAGYTKAEIGLHREFAAKRAARGGIGVDSEA